MRGGERTSGACRSHGPQLALNSCSLSLSVESQWRLLPFLSVQWCCYKPNGRYPRPSARRRRDAKGARVNNLAPSRRHSKRPASKPTAAIEGHGCTQRTDIPSRSRVLRFGPAVKLGGRPWATRVRGCLVPFWLDNSHRYARVKPPVPSGSQRERRRERTDDRIGTGTNRGCRAFFIRGGKLISLPRTRAPRAYPARPLIGHPARSPLCPPFPFTLSFFTRLIRPLCAFLLPRRLSTASGISTALCKDTLALAVKRSYAARTNEGRCVERCYRKSAEPSAPSLTSSSGCFSAENRSVIYYLHPSDSLLADRWRRLRFATRWSIARGQQREPDSNA